MNFKIRTEQNKVAWREPGALADSDTKDSKQVQNWVCRYTILLFWIWCITPVQRY
jgi:hypothetical protein